MLLSEKLGCPVLETVSTQSLDNGLRELVEEALAVVGTVQKAMYIQEDIDLDEDLPGENTHHDKQLKRVISSFLQSVDTNIKK